MLKQTDHQLVANFIYRICNLNSSVKDVIKFFFIWLQTHSLQNIKNYRNGFFYLLKLTPPDGNKDWKGKVGMNENLQVALNYWVVWYKILISKYDFFNPHCIGRLKFIFHLRSLIPDTNNNLNIIQMYIEHFRSKTNEILKQILKHTHNIF